MTLDEAIKHAEEVAEENENNAQTWHKLTKNRLVDFCDKAIQAENNCIKCGEEHRQLAEWLKELKQTRQAVQYIKAEIENMTEYPIFVDSDRGYIDKYDVLEIFDKYMNWEVLDAGSN